ncbi:MAG TPA: hypothetical protein VJH03_23825 [Blastocatellia bacterium]|nr:hypothetical protein [Blastocatellia bacterium]
MVILSSNALATPPRRDVTLDLVARLESNSAASNTVRVTITR